MRFTKLFGILLVTTGMVSCHGLDESYKDLSTGEKVDVAQDVKSGIMVNKKTGVPLYIYVDLIEDDTIYAKTGEVINGQVVKRGNKYVYAEDEQLKISESGEVKYSDGDYQIKVKDNGDIKIKDGDRKVKIDGKTGERKIDD